MLNVKNIDAVFNDIDMWLNHVEQQVETVAKALATEALIQAAYNSPQYSGDFAANWKLSVNAPNRMFMEGVFPQKQFPTKVPFIKGDAPAIQLAMTAAAGKLDSFKLGDTIWLSNSAIHHDLYAWKIENNRIKFRLGNSGAPLQVTHEYLRRRFAVIDRGSYQSLMGVGV